MKKTWTVLALGLAVLAAPALLVAQSEESAPGDETQVEKRLALREAGKASLVPPITSCGLITDDYVVTGSETSFADDEHCFPSDGTGIFGPRSDIPGLAIVDGMDVADMDNDGDNDFLACDGSVGEVYLYTQSPAGVFTPSLVANGVTSGVSGSLFCTNLREGDFNGDNLKDFVVGDNRVTKGMFLYLQGPVGTFTPVPAGLDVTWASPTGVPCNCLFGVAAGDVNGDGHDDVMVLGYRGIGTGQVWYYAGNGTGAMAPPVLQFNVTVDFPVVANPTGLALFDLEGDGDLDLLVGGAADGSHYVYTNDGLGNFMAPAGMAFDVNTYSGIDAYDVDGDLKEDAMLVTWSSRRLLHSQNLGGALAAPAAVGALDGPSIGIGAPADPEDETEFRLDHFKCYLAEPNKAVEEVVSLKDQFDEGKAFVIKTQRFCTPVEKRHGEIVTKILDKDAHLEFLEIEAQGRTPSLVKVNNQFGREQHLEIGPARFLAVPTQKIEPNNHEFPERLDHFKCYEVFGNTEPAIVDLGDQFGFEPRLKTFEPRLLCNPTQKVHNGEETPIQNPLDHLVCYQLEGSEPQIDGSFVRNQFGERQLQLDLADLLCLPSKKTVIE